MRFFLLTAMLLSSNAFADSSAYFSLGEANKLKTFNCEAYVGNTVIHSVKIESAHTEASEVFDQFLHTVFDSVYSLPEVGQRATTWNQAMALNGQVSITLTSGKVIFGGATKLVEGKTYELSEKSFCEQLQ